MHVAADRADRERGMLNIGYHRMDFGSALVFAA